MKDPRTIQESDNDNVKVPAKMPEVVLPALALHHHLQRLMRKSRSDNNANNVMLRGLNATAFNPVCSFAWNMNLVALPTAL